MSLQLSGEYRQRRESEEGLLDGLLISRTTSWLMSSRLRDARHTALTLMALRGVPLPVVAAWAGHADPAFTLRTYAHAQDEAMRDASASVARDFGDAL